jgi:hypothetical protein
MKNSPHQFLDFAVIGSQKCATTWMYDCMKNHPGLNMRHSKNEDIYFGSPWMQQHGQNNYFSMFDTESAMPKGCVSVEYIENETAPKLLFDANQKTKIIVSLRQPADRAISAVQWYVRKAYLPNVSPEEGIMEALAHFSGTASTKYSSAYKNILSRGLYAEKLKKWFEVFPSHQIKINLFDEVKNNPHQAIEDIFQFLQVDTNHKPPQIESKPKKNTGFAPLVKLQRLFPESTVIGKFVDKSNQLLYRTSKNSANTPVISQACYAALNTFYKDSLMDLQQLMAVHKPELLPVVKHYWK